MINVAICDDDVATTGKLETMLQEIAKRNFIQEETEVFWDGKRLVKVKCYNKVVTEVANKI